MNTPMSARDHVLNPEMLKMAVANFRRFPGLSKAAFIPGGDPSMMGGAPGGAGGDPAAGGGGDPAAMGMDPSMMGGGGGGGPPPPPPDPSMGGGGGGGDMGGITAKLDQMIQLLQGGAAGGVGGGAAGGAGGQIKPKIDVNVAIMQISKMLARIADSLGVQIPAAEMIATPNDLTAMAGRQATGGQDPAGGAGAGAGGDPAAGGGGVPGGIPPMPDMSAGPPTGGKTAQDARNNGRRAYQDSGVAYSGSGLESVMNKAAALARMRRRGRGRAA